MAEIERLTITLPPEMAAVVKQAVDDGRLRIEQRSCPRRSSRLETEARASDRGAFGA